MRPLPAWINGRRGGEHPGELGASCGHLRPAGTTVAARPAAQREILDDLAGHAALLLEVQTAHGDWLAAEAALEHLATAQRDRGSQLELLTFQVDELAALKPRGGEFAELEREHTALAHRLRIGEALERALARAYDDEDGSASCIGAARRALTDVLRFDRG